MNRGGWSDDDRVEFEALIDEALHEPVVADRRDVFLTGLDDAVKAHRFWALDINSEIRHDGADRILKREQDRRRPRVPVAANGAILGRMPRVVGRRERDEDGKVIHQRSAFDYLTWDELRDKIDEYSRNRRQLDVEVIALRRLLTLRDLVPGAATPAEACDQLGITVEEFLAAEQAS